MYSRPKPGETEEDLLRQQKEYFEKKAANSIKPAAKFVSEKKAEEESTENPVEVDIQEQLANTFEAIPTNINLGQIVENKTENQPVSLFKFNRSTGFPQAKRRDPAVNPKKGSIFSHQIKKLRQNDEPMDIDSNVNEERTSEAKDVIKLPEQSYILQGQESRQIHEENLRLLSGMSQEEIIKERQKLIETMDPAIIAYLKSKRAKQKVETRNPSIKEQNEAADVDIEEIETPAELLKQPKAEKWLNFDVVESNKLAWMKNVVVPKIEKDKQYEARFDFEGWLLPYAEPEINEKNRILYHHGEEPGRPGYTLQELFQLARSSVVQQKIIALNSIANILSLQSTGIYNNIIDIPIEQVFFVLRICLDENTPSVLIGSIKALRNLIYYQIDETCLDGLLGFGLGHIQPILAIDNDPEDDNTVNDQQLAETNLVKCVARTDILIRIRYILNTVKPALECVVYCLETLVRLARDSQFLFNKIISCEGLIDNIVLNFLPETHNAKMTNDSCYGFPLLQAVKLLRILSCRSRNFAEKLINKYKVMNSIIIYISNDNYSLNANGMRLQTECMHFWTVLLKYNLALDYFSVLEPVLLKLLTYHLQNTNVDNKTTFVRNGNVSAFFNLLGNVAQNQFVHIQPFIVLILQCLSKWGAQFTQLSEFSCGKLQIISSVLNTVASLRKSHPGLNPHYIKADEVILTMINSSGFSTVTEFITNGSMLLNNFETYKPSSNLKTIEGAAWDNAEHVVPVMQTKSCIPFLFNLSEYIKVTQNCDLKLTFLKHSNVDKYLSALKKLDQFYLTGNWFTRPESFFVMNLLKISVEVQKDLDTSTFYELAVKCLCAFNSEQKRDIEFVLRNIIFCPSFYPSEVLMKNLDINQRSDSLEVSLNNLDEILNVYTQVLGLENNIPCFTTNQCIDVSIGSVIPIDWIYTPIILLYSNQQQNKSAKEEEQIYVIRNCLRWILIYETYFPALAASIDPTDRFCRLACVFLGSDSLFLCEEIHTLLEVCFKNVIKFEKDLNFNKEIQGLSNFQDFYTQLLEQYQGVSYGDCLFGNIILVPLAQKHLKQFKKTLWSEYMGAVQIFNVTPEKLISSMEMYLEPPEEDMSLLKSYQAALISNSVRKNTVLYEIASKHVNEFIKRIKK